MTELVFSFFFYIRLTVFKAGLSGHNQYAPVCEGLDVLSHAYTSLHAPRYHVHARIVSL